MEIDQDELGAWLRLSLVPGVGGRSARRLLGALGGPQAVFLASDIALQQHINKNQIDALRAIPSQWPQVLDQAWAWCQTEEAGEQRLILSLGDPRYPRALLEIEDPPLLLYLRGRVDAWLSADGRSAAALAVVGSRNPTAQGAINARELAHACAQAGLCVVSGLALGVDSAAHEGALRMERAEAVTVAVVGTGLDRVYPRRNHDLAHRIAQRGVLVSEYPLGTPPLAANFPQRNRLISGLSVGTLVVEAALASGSLITARLALDQGKEVFAVPGSIHSPQSRGCHALLRDGAHLVESVQDVLEQLQSILRHSAWTALDAPVPGALPGAQVPAEEELLAELGWEPVGMDELLARTGQDLPALLASLLELELEGLVVRVPGGRYQRLAQNIRPG